MAASTAPHTVGIPSVGDTPQSVYQATEAIKQNIEIAHGFQAVVNSAKPNNTPTASSRAIGAAISAVKETLP